MSSVNIAPERANDKAPVAEEGHRQRIRARVISRSVHTMAECHTDHPELYILGMRGASLKKRRRDPVNALVRPKVINGE